MTRKLQLNLSEDAYQGDAMFTVTLDGVLLGPAQAVTALHSAGATEAFTFTGDWSAGPHDVTVTFLNDAWGGTSSTDRNLYVSSASYDGAICPGASASLTSSGDTAKFIASSVDTLQLGLNEDAYQGDAQFAVSIDGKQIGSTQTVTALHSAGAGQLFTFTGGWGTAPHNVVVTFLNDAYGGTSSSDRNLYLLSANFDGKTYSNVGGAMMSTGAALRFTVQGSATSSSTGAAAGRLLLGVNLAGAEFGGAVSGTYGTDYIYPSHGEIDYYASKGMSIIRLPFLWERVQPIKNGPLSSAELSRINDVVTYAASKGLQVDLDLHNYGYGYGHMVGSPDTPASAFADLWGKLAKYFASSSNVLFGLMNEPHDQTATGWAPAVQSAINAIRAAGATREILVSGTYWDGASNWTTSDNAGVLGAGISDPLNNFAFEVHQYLDGNGSGTNYSPITQASIGADRLASITSWAEQTGNRLFLGEFGVPPDQQSLTALSNMLGFMQQHTAAWQGGTYWAGGPWWGSSYPFSIEPTGSPGAYTEAAQMGVLSRFIG